MKFSGVGIVKRRGKIIARFIDNEFETNDPAVQELLKSLNFPEVGVEPVQQAAPAPEAPKPKAKRKARK